MTKNEYLAELKSQLISLPVEERDAAIRYYHEFFEDAGPEREQEIIEELGSPAELAQNIIDEANHTEESSTEFIPARYGEKEKEKTTPPPRQPAPERRASNNSSLLRSAFLIFLIILFSPLLLALAAVGFCLFAAALVLIFSLWVACFAIVLGFVLGGALSVVVGIAESFTSMLGLAAVGFGLVLAALGILMIIPFMHLTTKTFPAVVRGFVNFTSAVLKNVRRVVL